MMRRWLAGLCLVFHAAAVVLPPPAAAAEATRALEERDTTSPTARALSTSGSSSERTPWVLASAAGLLAGIGVGVWLKAEADERFDAYRATADQDRASALFESSQRYDRASLIGWGVAQVSFLALFYLLTREDDRPLVPVAGQPLLRAGADRIQVGWSWHP